MWKSAKTWIAVAAAGLGLVACGGGSDPVPYGAIALNASAPSALIVSNFESQAQANTSALSKCGSTDCAIVLEFAGEGSCGALATGGGSSLVWGVSTGSTQAEAEAAAVASCSAKGGSSCSIPASIPGKCQ